MEITRRIEVDLHDQLQINVQKFVSVPLALDESMDIGSTMKLLIFLRGVTNDFQVSEELLVLVSSKERTRVCDLFEVICDTIDKSNLKWSQSA